MENYFELLEQSEHSLIGHRENNKLKPIFQEVAKIMDDQPIRVYPNPPHTNMFLAYIKADAKAFNEKHLKLMEKCKAPLFLPLSNSHIPGFIRTEIHLFSRALNFDLELLKQMIDELFEEL